MHLEALTLDRFEELHRRFLGFHDAIFRKVEVLWGGGDRRWCEFQVDAIDSSSEESQRVFNGLFAPHACSRITFQVNEMLDFCWQPDWQGSVETTDLRMFEFDKSAVIAVVTYDRLPQPLTPRFLHTTGKDRVFRGRPLFLICSDEAEARC